MEEGLDGGRAGWIDGLREGSMDGGRSRWRNGWMD
jgi:hypothetical protein